MTSTTGGRVALVTGANKGIGYETARRLGALGYTVLVGARDARRGAEAIRSLVAGGADAHFLHLDVCSAASIAAAAATVQSDFGRLDVLINNAGVNCGASDPQQLDLGNLRTELETNLVGVIATTNAFLPLVKRSSAGRIVVVSSILGSKGELQREGSTVFGNAHLSGYCISKAAVNMYVVNLAASLKDTAVKVNSAHPGWVKTDMGGENAPLSVEEGAETSVYLATLPADGPTGGFFFQQSRLPW